MNHFTRLISATLLCAALAFQGCSATKNLPKETLSSPVPMGQVGGDQTLFLPKNAFPSKPSQPPALSQAPANLHVTGQALGLKPMVWLYASPTSKALYASSAADFQNNIRQWETFLSKYHVPFKTITSPAQLESSTPGVLVLPSLVALSDKERLAIDQFRQAGGSVLSSWLTGVRDEQGTWLGFDFMNKVLNVDVLGDTEGEDAENYLLPFGNGAISHSVNAGQRIWLERIKGHYPLRLRSQQTAAVISDWSRTAIRQKPSATLVFNETPQLSGALSRSVHFGYSERLWVSADPKAIEALAHNALTWLLRQPDSHLSAWPYPYRGALSVVVDAPEVVDELDLAFASSVAQAGAKTSFYTLTSELAKSAATLKSIQAQGHELGYMADRFEGFDKQSADVQQKRLLTMQDELKTAGLTTGKSLGFHAPMESTDTTTRQLLNQLGFTHVVSANDTTEDRLPFTTPRSSASPLAQHPMVTLPRTLSDPEVLINEGDPAEGLKQALAEFDLSLHMGGLTLVRFQNQTLLNEEALMAIFSQYKQNTAHLWSATTADVAHWWLDHERLKVGLTAVKAGYQLTVTLSPGEPLTLPAAVIVNLPYPHDQLSLTALGHTMIDMKIQALDPWRTAVSMGALKPGSYRWLMQFTHALAPNAASK